MLKNDVDQIVLGGRRRNIFFIAQGIIHDFSYAKYRIR